MHRDRVVLKQELLEHVWPDQFISDATFDHCIMVARKAVGDNGRVQRIIKTIRGRGYRFVATVEVHAPTLLEPEAAPQPYPGTEGGDTTAASLLAAAPAGRAAHEHPPPSGDALFCPTCGMPLHLICPQCHHKNAPGSKFCNACGTALVAAAPRRGVAPDISPLSYTPRHLANEILTTRSALEGERKQVTVLFCDLVSSTPLAERLGPEGMHALLNRFFEFALSAVHRYGGTINQFLGSGSRKSLKLLKIKDLFFVLS